MVSDKARTSSWTQASRTFKSFQAIADPVYESYLLVRPFSRSSGSLPNPPQCFINVSSKLFAYLLDILQMGSELRVVPFSIVLKMRMSTSSGSVVFSCATV
ncbi:hypothetical protein K435DRAFT_794432 [Dendrothele bispora CBS 962.96]|uniref:Uncharacterized protein n=1 Tax=Dendrothele bispora (strain CBS 962.96) TaxID=1314807 RepID=A0A4S8MDG3_DENBC|nr:hypothetical protein K435DRAFT_794432 [Dendrothele bispora CBS 962.96]